MFNVILKNLNILPVVIIDFSYSFKTFNKNQYFLSLCKFSNVDMFQQNNDLAC